MREAQFLKQNAEKWKVYEAEIKQHQHPDLLADRFIELTDDLSYAKTFYPGYLQSSELQSPAGHALWVAALEARRAVIIATEGAIALEHVGIAVNSKGSRSQDQLHLQSIAWTHEWLRRCTPTLLNLEHDGGRCPIPSLERAIGG